MRPTRSTTHGAGDRPHPIFRDDPDRTEFSGAWPRSRNRGPHDLRWALLPRTASPCADREPALSRSMRCLLTGYAGAFTRRHKRVGHLFQNRYTSIVVEEAAYLLELVRYLHLNPVRAIIGDVASGDS